MEWNAIAQQSRVCPNATCAAVGGLSWVENRMAMDLAPYVLGAKGPAQVLTMRPEDPVRVHVVPRPGSAAAVARGEAARVVECPPWFCIHLSHATQSADGAQLRIYGSGWPRQPRGADGSAPEFLGAWGGEAPSYDKIPLTNYWETRIDLRPADGGAPRATRFAPFPDARYCVEHPHVHPAFECGVHDEEIGAAAEDAPRYAFMSISNEVGLASACVARGIRISPLDRSEATAARTRGRPRVGAAGLDALRPRERRRGDAIRRDAPVPRRARARAQGGGARRAEGGGRGARRRRRRRGGGGGRTAPRLGGGLAARHDVRCRAEALGARDRRRGDDGACRDALDEARVAARPPRLVVPASVVSGAIARTSEVSDMAQRTDDGGAGDEAGRWWSWRQVARCRRGVLLGRDGRWGGARVPCQFRICSHAGLVRSDRANARAISVVCRSSRRAGCWRWGRWYAFEKKRKPRWRAKS